MSDTQFHWFVQLIGGVVLGPMPRSTLEELARSGGLLPDDLVRAGEDGRWVPASQVSGLNLQNVDESLTISPVAEVADRGRSESEVIVANRQPGESISLSVSESVSESVPESDAAAGQPVAPDESQWFRLVEEDRVREFRPAESAADRAGTGQTRQLVTFDDDDQSRRTAAVRETAKPQPEQQIDQIELPELEGDSDDSVDTAYRFRTRRHPHVPGENPTGGQLAAPLSREEWTSPKRQNSVAGRVSPDADSSRSRLFRRIMMTAAGGVLLLIAVVSGSEWRQSRRVAGNFEEFDRIHRQLLAFDAGEPEAGDWERFREAASQQLNAALPWLEETAGPGDRARSLLLYVGRDLLVMLDYPPGSQRPHERRVAGFLAQLRKIDAADHD